MSFPFRQFGKLLLAASLAVPIAALSLAQTSHPAPSTNPSQVERHQFVSAAMQRSMPYQILLPVDYNSTQERYPVLYLLHGWQGDETNYLQLTNIASAASPYPLIIVMPRADNSWYVNSATVSRDRYADYIFTDLIHETDAHFRTIASPQGRAIAGLSMGGYGALLLSLQHPDAFRFVGSLSGAFAGPTGIENVMPVLKPSTDAAFGPSDSDARKSNNLDSLLAAVSPVTQPYLFLACGTSDPLLASDRHVVEELSAHGFAYEYHELPGAHTWPFWSSQLGPMFAVLAREMHLARSSSPNLPIKSPL